MNRLKEKLGPEFVLYVKRWEKKKEKIIEEFIDSVIRRFEDLADAGAINPLFVEFSLSSLCTLGRDEVEDTIARLELLGFSVKYFGPGYLPCSHTSYIHISLNRKKSKAEASECSH